MQKEIFESIKLTCLYQNTQAPGVSSVLSGMLSRDLSGDMLFQETLPRRRDIRNTKLYEGEHVSLVRRKDGRYYPLLKAFRPEDAADKSTLAFRIYSEISEALNVID